ncbi:hypothetical protein [Alienimonas sp. DA493]|uniref:hypothetical protein n=1 Tax=Alienimonas sp. DA493 TaxID=3373605 RepID=UPI003754B7D5
MNKKPREPLTPVIVPDGVYFAADVEATFKLKAGTMAQWKREGLRYAEVGAGHIVRGSDVIRFLFPDEPPKPKPAPPAQEPKEEPKPAAFPPASFPAAPQGGPLSPADKEWGYVLFCEGALKVRAAMEFANCGRSALYSWAKLPPPHGIRMSNSANGQNARVCRRSLREHLSRRMGGSKRRPGW